MPRITVADIISKEYQSLENFRALTIQLLRKKAEQDGTQKLAVYSITKDQSFPSVKLLEYAFGSIDDAVRAAGLYPACPNTDDLLRSLREFKATYGRPPRIADASIGVTIYGHTTYVRLLGGWNNALKMAELSVTKPRGGHKRVVDHSSLSKAVAEVQRLYGATGVLPTINEHNRQHPELSAVSLIQQAGKWSHLAELAGLQMQSSSQSS